MHCSFDLSLITGYHSQSQIIRVLTENWISQNMYCPRCGHTNLEHFPNNSAVADFYCPKCNNEYELKSKAGHINHKINDGAYNTFIDRITSNNNPDFFIMSYDKLQLSVRDLWIIPKSFFVPEIVERRKALSDSARRKGWIGCNILIDKIPTQGKINIIHNTVPVSKAIVQEQVHYASSLMKKNIDARGWLLDILQCVNSIDKDVFELNDVYSFENYLKIKHAENHNIRAKIRQQLQFLRDKGFIKFLGRGLYHKIR